MDISHILPPTYFSCPLFSVARHRLPRILFILDAYYCLPIISATAVPTSITVIAISIFCYCSIICARVINWFPVAISIITHRSPHFSVKIRSKFDQTHIGSPDSLANTGFDPNFSSSLNSMLNIFVNIKIFSKLSFPSFPSNFSINSRKESIISSFISSHSS